MEDGNARAMCDCGWRGTVADLLRAPDPFNPGEELTACPQCRQQDELQVPCEIDGCWKQASCGGKHKDGIYRQTCGAHACWR